MHIGIIMISAKKILNFFSPKISIHHTNACVYDTVNIMSNSASNTLLRCTQWAKNGNATYE